MDGDKCKKMIFKDYHSYQCSRARGYGPDEAYCKQHAEKYDTAPTFPMWRVSKWNDVEEVEVQKVTEKSVWISGRRESISSEYYAYFKNRDAAYNKAIARERATEEMAHENIMELIVDRDARGK